MKFSRSVVLPAYNDNLVRALLGFKIEDVSLPPLKSDEVLIQMEAAPCNPSDIAFIRGGYNIVKSLPAVPGFEGAGTVVKTGNEVTNFSGKKVSCFVQEDSGGTWSEYFIAKAKDCIVLKEKLDIQQAACLSINPLTAFGLFEWVKINKCKAIIQNAGGGQVARMINYLAGNNGVEVINLVRKPDHLYELQKSGNKYVLNVADENFSEEFKQVSEQLKPTMAIDAVGGEITGMMLNVMPAGSQIVVYGGLSGASISGIDPMGIIFDRKIMKGFNLNDWLPQLKREEFEKITDEIQDLLISGRYRTAIQGTFKLDDVVSGIRTYIKSMSSGKILLIP